MVENGEKGKYTKTSTNSFWDWFVCLSEFQIKLHDILLTGCRSRRPERFSDITHVSGQIFPGRRVGRVNSRHHATFVLPSSEAINT